jgi:hypothetical protein
MKIPQKTMKQQERGDIMAIVSHSGISRPTITKAMKSGNGSRKTVTAILAYYESLKLAK